MSFATAGHLDDVGSALLRAADGLLATEGPSALTVRRIAAEAGMSTMNVYSRFGGKDGVVEQLFLHGFELLAGGMGEVGATDDPIADLRRCGQAYRRFASEHSTLYSVMFERVVADYEPTPAAKAAALGTLELLAARLQRAMDAGLVRRMDATHAAAIVWSTCHGVISLQLKHDGITPVDWQQVFADATEAVVSGLAP
ncbi:MAG: TetR/AcrR family transcriptional regulator [Actinobacteria bacterium]|nr:TetR/AcrR family transcriptional regulator [Acidimicrobiaceae bacterium]MBP6488026.1 TetR/AcrR family transcriptional regulator [Ilumatobacteraceae bacterium]NMD24685.1 TetR/AcrR family transcriptional regulator [Actinomycetota bacterium]MBP7890174.1 TetR/AcrR family transcriptional regulator [Ilumatobacteraceae bacterium]MBP8209449.1 TetR/AcrR family transcriptional regulator [Ilumatobacteraceae bacterium]